MKFSLGRIDKAEYEWHLWFAWHPIRLDNSHECRWLETIERRNTFYSSSLGPAWIWEYRQLGDFEGFTGHF